MAESEFRLPSFQREAVWSVDQQAIFLSRLMRGYPFGTVLAWEREYQSPWLVLDGQQRLTALGAKLVRQDGSVNKSAALYFDVEAWLSGQGLCWFSKPQGPRPMMVHNFLQQSFYEDVLQMRSSRGELTEVERWLIEAFNAFNDQDVHIQVIDWSVTVDQAMEIFAAANTGGTPMSNEEVARLIAEAKKGSL